VFHFGKKMQMYSTSRENKTTSDPNLQQLSEAISPKQVSGIFYPLPTVFLHLKWVMIQFLGEKICEC